MNVENYRQFLEAIGHQVIASSSGYWFDIGRSFYESIPPFEVITPDETELKELFRRHRVIGFKYCAPPNGMGKSSWIYVCQDKDYDIKSLHRKMRNKVRQGLRACHVHPISFEYLHDYGMRLNQDTLERQNRDEPLFSDPAQWERLCQAGQRIEGAKPWGAFTDDQLAAYMITFLIDGYYNILYQMSRTDLLSAHANNAIAFVATREMLASPGVEGVSYGHASIRDLPGLEEYKTRLGYKKWPMRYVVTLHPLLSPILLSRSSEMLLNRLGQFFPDNDVLKQINGIVDIARQSKDSDVRRRERIQQAQRRISDAQENV